MTYSDNVESLRNSAGDLPHCSSLGGYTLIYLTAKDDVLCADCVNAGDTDDHVALCDVYWEGPDTYCDECSEPIESSYGDPDAEEGN